MYVVATPIGNLGDITLRALETLQGADVIACEDTRVTGNMARRLDIQTPLTPYHEHNAEAARPKLIDRMKNGGAVALVSDAGTPLVSDPGYKLVRAVVEEGLKVVPLPGASAALAALVVAGLPSDRFLFCGFPPQKTKARRDWLAEVAGIGATLVIYEGPSRLAASLADMAEVLGAGREAAVCRELTKLYEETRRGTLADLAARYAAEAAPKGEVVVVVGPPAPAEAATEEDLDAMLRAALDRGESVRDAAAAVAAATGLKKRAVYARALDLAKG
ncbi:rRNA small subunit methyltransferase I [Caenispirillum salinarum AK4]|uniref:Ribosomal RNA small subunit methyltransferase I n=1 Tax=Caenispirillum salinarum AK4 TaxID=1238182 RepID=K9HDS8_9PROT|nr:rRNA small subunit methyltransferase I [Caenispirillum salinarum AK4]